MGFYPKDKTEPLFTFEKDRNVPHFGEEGLGPMQSSIQAEQRVSRAAKRAGNRHKQGGKTNGK